MAKNENPNTPSARQRLLDRARERFTDRTFSDLDAQTPAEGAADLDDAIDEMLTDYATRQATYDENDNRLKELLVSDPSSAEFIQRWVEKGDPRVALIETFGDDLGISEESAAGFENQLADWRQRKADNDRLNSEAETNWQNSLAALKEWGDGRGLSLEQERDVMLRLLAITFNGMENKYGPEDFTLALNAINHDSDVEQARTAGEVEGRNQRIAATRRARSAADNLPPSGSAGQGGRVAEARPKERSFWNEVNNG